MNNTSRAALGLTLTALALIAPTAVVQATTPTPPSTDGTDTSGPAPDDPFCAAGFVLLEAEALLDARSIRPEAVRTNMRQLVRAAGRAAAVTPSEVGDLDELVVALEQLEAHFAEHGFDMEAASADPAFEPLDDAYNEHDDVADAATDYIEDTCVRILEDEEARTRALCAAMGRLGVADRTFAEARAGDDPGVVEAAWNGYLHAFDEARMVGPAELRDPWDALRATLGETEALLADGRWDYAALEDDPAFEDLLAVYEEPEIQRWSATLTSYVDSSCERSELTPETTGGATATTTD